MKQSKWSLVGERPKNCRLESQLVCPQSCIPPAQPIPRDLEQGGDESQGGRAGNATLRAGWSEGTKERYFLDTETRARDRPLQETLGWGPAKQGQEGQPGPAAQTGPSGGPKEAGTSLTLSLLPERPGVRSPIGRTLTADGPEFGFQTPTLLHSNFGSVDLRLHLLTYK